jgi:DNA-binding response OmpR family regulator
LKQPKLHILCIGDNVESCDWFSIISKQVTYEVVVASSKEQGLFLARSRKFDFFIINVQLPDGSGIELCREIRAFDKATSILFFSDKMDVGQVVEAIKTGAQAYLLNSYPSQIYKETIERQYRKL